MTATLEERLFELAIIDREQTVKALVDVLAKLGVVRPIETAMVYDPRVIKAHAMARQNSADQIGTFLLDHEVIEFQRKAIGPREADLRGVVWVMIPARLQEKPEPAGEGRPN
jgi:hypothetical protein